MSAAAPSRTVSALAVIETTPRPFQTPPSTLDNAAVFWCSQKTLRLIGLCKSLKLLLLLLLLAAKARYHAFLANLGPSFPREQRRQFNLPFMINLQMY